ncbi:MAG TPA: response regulator [Candidatus Synoicihabitans sp.]|nr:response regulator [Candidatus Synoicihabitans sp.]
MCALPAPAREIEILLVDDNEGDVFLTLHTFQKKLKLANRIEVARDGSEALDFLYRRPPFENAPRPDLILLDLNMPRVGGLEVLEQVKQDPNLQTIPVIIMTGSDAETDIVRSYTLHASCYITKPIKLDGFVSAMASLADFWLSVVKLPPQA